jgi:hypothetical protein
VIAELLSYPILNFLNCDGVPAFVSGYNESSNNLSIPLIRHTHHGDI